MSELNDILNELQQEPATFKEGGWHSPEGDCYFYFRAPSDYYAERINDLVTAFRDVESNEIVGVQVKMADALVKNPLYCDMVEAGRVDIIALIMLTYHMVDGGRALMFGPKRPPSPVVTSRYSEMITAFSAGREIPTPEEECSDA